MFVVIVGVVLVLVVSLSRVLLVGLFVVVGRAGRLSLLLMKSLSTASHFKLSSAVASQVMSLVRSLLGHFGCRKINFINSKTLVSRPTVTRVTTDLPEC